MEAKRDKYTIKEKDGYYFVIPLLRIMANHDLLIDLKYFAKGLLGEFSENDGFIFKSKEYAEKFGNRIDNYLNTNRIVKLDKELEKGNSKTNEELKKYTKTHNTKYDIDFICETIYNIVDKKGTDYLNNKSVIKDLSILNAFKDLPKSIEFIIINFILKKYPEKLYEIGEWNEKCNLLKSSFIEETGFKDELVDLVFDIFGYAYNWIDFN